MLRFLNPLQCFVSPKYCLCSIFAIAMLYWNSHFIFLVFWRNSFVTRPRYDEVETFDTIGQSSRLYRFTVVTPHTPRIVHSNIIGSDNGLSPGRRQAIIWTNDLCFVAVYCILIVTGYFHTIHWHWHWGNRYPVARVAPMKNMSK